VQLTNLASFDIIRGLSSMCATDSKAGPALEKIVTCDRDRSHGRQSYVINKCLARYNREIVHSCVY
jgi:hypothetical protein